MREVKTGAVGCGNMGRSHARCIAGGTGLDRSLMLRESMVYKRRMV